MTLAVDLAQTRALEPLGVADENKRIVDVQPGSGAGAGKRFPAQTLTAA